MTPELFELIKLAVTATTPISVVVLGLAFLRKVEGVKAEVTKQSDFHKKWAEAFFDTCQQFMSSMERYMALLNQIKELENPNGLIGTAHQNELNSLNVVLSELELRIRRSVVFAPVYGLGVSVAAKEAFAELRQMVNTMQGSFDSLHLKINLFNKAVKVAHSEMLGLNK